MAKLYRCDSCSRESEKIPTIPFTIGGLVESAIGNYGSIDLCEHCIHLLKRPNVKQALITVLQEVATDVQVTDD